MGSNYRFVYIDELIETTDSAKLITKALALVTKEGISSAAVIGGKYETSGGASKDSDPSSGNTIDEVLAISNAYDFSFDPETAYTSIATLDSEENKAGLSPDENLT